MSNVFKSSLSRQRRSRVQAAILLWGIENYQDYPWRKVEDPWLALLAEVLLQRTNAAHVERYYAQICEMFPTPDSVIAAPKEKLDRVTSMFGLGRRMKTLVELAYFIDGLDYYPDNVEQLVGVYGIGHYTAAAFLSLHRNVRGVLVDSNVARLLARVTGQDKPKDIRRSQGLFTLADELTPEAGYRLYNYALLDFTMLICRPVKPKCHECPIHEDCSGSVV